MKKFSLIFCFCLLFTILFSCERADYSDEIEETFRRAAIGVPDDDPDYLPDYDQDYDQDYDLDDYDYENDEPDNIIDGNMWSEISPQSLSWEEAFSYCKNLGELGYSDWRLPTVDELRTLIQNCPNHESDGQCTMTDKCLTNPGGCDFNSENCSCCSFAPNGFYNKLGNSNTPLWSSLVCISNPIRSWIVGFEYGCITTAAKVDDTCRYVHARCVRKAD